MRGKKVTINAPPPAIFNTVLLDTCISFNYIRKKLMAQIFNSGIRAGKEKDRQPAVSLIIG
jgi:hypothetical protein